MAIPYRIMSRIHPGNPKAARKYYPVVRSRGRQTKRELAEAITRRFAVSSADTYGVLEALLGLITETLLRGYLVDLGDFGSFSVSVHSEGAESPEDVTVKNIKQIRVIFRPGKRFKSLLKGAKFEKFTE